MSKSVKDMTDEELLEFASAFEKEDIPAEQMTDDELLEFEETTKVRDAKEIDEIVASAEEPEEISALEAAGLGIAKGGTMGFAPRFGAAVHTARETIFEDKPFSEIANTYSENKKIQDQIYKDAEDQNPWSFGVADFTAGVAAGGAAKGLKAVTALGALEGYGRGEGLKDAAVGAGFGAGFGMLSKAFGKGVAAAKNKVMRETNEQAETYFQKMLGLEGDRLISFKKYLNSTGQSFNDLIDDLSSIQLKDGRQLMSVKNIDELVDHLPHVIDDLDTQATSLVKDLPGTIDGKKIYDRLVFDLDNVIEDTLLEPTDPKKKAALMLKRNLKALLMDEDVVERSVPQKAGTSSTGGIIPIQHGIEVTKTMKGKKLTPYELKQINRNIRKNIKSFHDPKADSAENELRKNLNIALKDEVEQSIDALGDASKLKNYKEILKTESNLLKFRDRILPKYGTSKETWTESLGEYLNFRGALAGSIASAAGAPAPAAIAVGLAFNKILSHKNLNPNQVRRLRKISENMIHNPEKFHQIATSFMRQVGSETKQANEAEIMRHIGLMESTMTLTSKPVTRDIDGVMLNKDHIANLINSVDPALADRFRSAVARNDEQSIGIVMSQLSKMPEAVQYVEPGVGWGGRLWNEEDKEAVRGTVKGNRKLTTRQRRMAMEQIDAGYIPQPPKQKQPSKEEQLIKERRDGRKVEEF